MPELNEEGISLISTTLVDHSGIAPTTLYTVPASFTFMPDHVKIKAAGDEGATIISLGLSTALTDFCPNNTLSNLDIANDMVIVRPIPNTTPLKSQVYTAGEIFQVDVTTNVGNALNTYYLYGTLIAV